MRRIRIDFAVAVEIRPVRPDEFERVHFLVAYSFSGDRTEEGRERYRHVEEMAPGFGLFEDGEMVACLRIFPLAMIVNGSSLPMGGVSSVACLPEHRRKGYVGELLRYALGVMREQGQAISALFTPHPSLYRRYGWMVASTGLIYKFRPKDIAPVKPGRPRGRAYRAGEEDWPTLSDVYQRFVAGRNGYMDRSERWWKEAVLRRIYDEKRRLSDVAVWSDEGGEPRGYVTYQNIREPGRDGFPSDRTAVREFMALDGDAYTGLLRYLLSHDLADEISWFGPADAPLILAVDDSGRVKGERFDGFMLRVVDVEKAVAGRPPATAAPEGAFALRVSDAAAAWNQATWRIECAGGKLSAHKTDGAADIATDAATFAAMYNGFLRPSEAVRAGLAEADDTERLSLADRILATDYPPAPGDFF